MSNSSKNLQPKPILYLNLRIFFLFGLYLITFTSPFARGLFFQSDLLPLLIITAVSFAFCIYDLVIRRELRFFEDPLDWAILALVAAYALSLITAVYMRQAISELLKVTAYLMIYWMACRAVKKERDLNIILIIVFWAGIGVVAIGLAAAAGIINVQGAYENGIILSTFQYKNTLAIYLAVINLIGLAFSVRTKHLFPKLLYAAGNFLTLVVIIGTQSRGGWILYPLAMAAFIALINNTYRWRAVYHLMIFLGCGLVSAQVFYNSIKAGTDHALIEPLAIGLLAVVVLQLLYHGLGSWMNRDEVQDSTRRLVAGGGVVYLGLVIMVYLWYAASAFPVATTQLMSETTMTRAQTISGQDPNFKDRIEYSKDALRIVKDHLLTGAGGGGWNALYHSYASRIYWTTETHNYFFQTWVEAGSIGFIALLAIWFFLIRLLLRIRMKEREEEPDPCSRITFWAVAVAVFALGIHSAFDFDLSMAAVGFLLYMLIGVIRANSVNNATDIAKSRSEKKIEKPVPSYTGKLIITALLGTVLSLAVAYPAYSFYSAGVAGAEGARAINAQDFDQARISYEQAVKKDPFTASYWADLAQIWAIQAVVQDDAIAHIKSMEYAQKAARAEPYNTTLRSTLINVYSLLKEDDSIVEEAEALVKANPLVIQHQEILTTVLLEAAKHHLANDNNNEQADIYLKRILQIIQNPLPTADETTPAMKLAAGQAALLLGDASAAQNYLVGIKDEGLVYQSQLWLAAAYSCGGNDSADKILNKLSIKNKDTYADYQNIMNMIKKHK